MPCQARAAASTVFSSQARPMNCRLMGRPSAVKPLGTADGGEAGKVADGAHRITGRALQAHRTPGRGGGGVARPAGRDEGVEAARARDRPPAPRRPAQPQGLDVVLGQDRVARVGLIAVLGRGELRDRAALDHVLESARRLGQQDRAGDRLVGQIGAASLPRPCRSPAAPPASARRPRAPAAPRPRPRPRSDAEAEAPADDLVGLVAVRPAGCGRIAPDRRPAIASRTRPQSSAVNASGPSLSSVQQSAIAP